MPRSPSIPSATPGHWTRSFWSGWICLLFLISAWSDIQDIGYWKDLRVLSYDAEAYYHYLPATLLHGDVRDLSYVPDVDTILHPAGDQVAYGVFPDSTTSHDRLKYTLGVALFQAPLFLLAHTYCSWIGECPAPTGYSAPYQLAVSLSTLLFVFLGLLILRRFLLRHVDDRAAAVALLTLAFGTNLYFYSTVNPGMSHGYAFFLFALFLDLTDRWHGAPTRGKAFALGLTLGLIVLTRPVDALVVLIPLFWPIGAGQSSKWELWRQQGSHIALALVVAFLTMVPQLLYWRATSGHFLFYSYGGEWFSWNDPHILDGLFSFRKGWLIYSPLVGLGFLGMALMVSDQRWRALTLPLLVFFPIAFYVVFSWHQWWYGGGFGARALVDTLPLLALPIAVLAAKAFKKHLIINTLLIGTILSGVYLNRFQQRQYLQTIIHWDAMTEQRYWEVWGVDRWDDLSPFP